jgi:heptosyltransferase II
MSIIPNKRILIIGPAWVGDMVMAQTLFKLLKQREPSTLIDVLAPAWTFPLLRRMPEVTQAIEMPFAHGELKLYSRYQLAKTLRKEQYDQAIILPNSFKSALIPWLAGIPKRTGWLGEYRYGLLNDVRHLDPKSHALMIQQFMALGLEAHQALPEVPPYPSFAVSPESQAATLAKFKLSLDKRPVLALCAGAEFGPAKRWPEEYFAEIARQKMLEGWQVWLFGSPKDRTITENIMQLTEDRCEHLAGRLALYETIDLLSLASGVISNDSGLMHIAAALQKPVIAIYGSTSPAFTPPLSTSATILKRDLECQPCFARSCPLGHLRCLTELKPQQVLAAMETWEVQSCASS